MSEILSQETIHELEEFRKRYHRLNQRFIEERPALDWHTGNSIIFEHGALRLRYFHSENSHGTPLLIIYSHINRPCIIDLDNAHSLIQCMLGCGHSVYLLDWGEVRTTDQENELAVYIRDYLDIATNHLLKITGLPSINLMGICQGGTFSLCYASLYPQKIKSVVTLVTPVDFRCGGSLLAHWAHYIDFALLEKNPRNLPGALFTMLFQTMRPFEDLVRQVRLIDQSADSTELDFMMKMDQWIYDCPDQPGRAFSQFMQWFYQDNALVNGTLTIAGQKVDLSNLTMPTLNIYARNDHLVPPESSRALGPLTPGRKYQEMEFDGGHIGLLVSKKSLQSTLSEAGQWLSGR